MTSLQDDSKKLIVILNKRQNNLNNLKDLLCLSLKRQITSISNFLAYSIIKALIRGLRKLIISYKIWRKVGARNKISYCIREASRVRMRRTIRRSQFWRRFYKILRQTLLWIKILKLQCPRKGILGLRHRSRLGK